MVVTTSDRLPRPSFAAMIKPYIKNLVDLNSFAVKMLWCSVTLMVNLNPILFKNHRACEKNKKCDQWYDFAKHMLAKVSLGLNFKRFNNKLCLVYQMFFGTDDFRLSFVPVFPTIFVGFQLSIVRCCCQFSRILHIIFKAPENALFKSFCHTQYPQLDTKTVIPICHG